MITAYTVPSTRCQHCNTPQLVRKDGICKSCYYELNLMNAQEVDDDTVHVVIRIDRDEMTRWKLRLITDQHIMLRDESGRLFDAMISVIDNP